MKYSVRVLDKDTESEDDLSAQAKPGPISEVWTSAFQHTQAHPNGRKEREVVKGFNPSVFLPSGPPTLL